MTGSLLDVQLKIAKFHQGKLCNISIDFDDQFQGLRLEDGMCLIDFERLLRRAENCRIFLYSMMRQKTIKKMERGRLGVLAGTID